MKIAFDIDDTITRCPEFFAFLSQCLKQAGHAVFIVSYRSDRESTRAELADLNVVYDELILPKDDELDAQGFYEWKSETCRRLGIDVFFEDMPEVVNQLDDSVLCFVPFDPELGRLSYIAGPEEQ